jgi:quinoprotein glucose dehydrogenase
MLLSFFLLRGADMPKQPYTAWSDYGGAVDSMQYSALKQIDKSNVSKLELAWFYPVPDRTGNFGFNPIVAEGMMYVLGPKNSIVALDPLTGKQLWSHPADQNIVSQRGITYWHSKDGSDRRLIFGEGSYLTEINARTGVTINTFGDDGRVNMRVGTPRPLGGPSATPGRIFENLIIVGSQTGEGYGSAPGDVRAYDAVTGKLVWDFHTIPHPGEFGYDTWPKDAWTYIGGVNTWGEISIDEKRGIAYFPLGSPTHDMYGGDRKGAGLFGDCLLALDIRTGKRLWHFQVVHHDLWDYDPTAAPKLLTVRHNGKMVDIVALPTKFGLLYVFNRVTGEPLWPIEERPVPQSDVPGEQSWPTQPFPTIPPPFARLKFGPDDINPYLEPEERAKLREIMLASRNEGLFTPQTLGRNQISSPGELGGANWGGSAGDPTTGMLYVRSADQPGFHTLREPGARGGGGGQGGTPAQRGRAAFTQLCQDCHGQAEANGIHSMGGATMIPVKELGAERIRRTVRSGMGQMPPFETDALTDENLNAIITYLADPAAGRGGGGGGGGRNTTPLPPIEGVTRYTGPLGSMFRAANGMVAISPPWAQITAYDLNEGTIKWQAPLGTVEALAAKGIKNTGNAERIHRNGPAVTAGGLIFVGSSGDRTLHAYDKDNGKILWEHQLEANPEGLASVYEVGGREYVAFCASGSAGPDTPPGERISFVMGKASAQGYYVFALPKSSSLPSNSKK